MARLTITKLEQAQLKTLVEKANKRLQALEKANMTNSPAYKHLEKLLFDNSNIVKSKVRVKQGNKYIYIDSPKPRYRTDINKFVKEINSKKQFNKFVNDVNKFINAKTSSPSKINKMYKQAFDTFSEVYGGFSFDEFLEFWSNAVVQQAKKIYGSDTVIDLHSHAINSGMSTDDFIGLLSNKLGQPYMNIIEDIDQWYYEKYGDLDDNNTIDWLHN